MKVSPIVATLVLGAMFSLQAWTLREVVSLKVQVAVLADRANIATAQK